MRNRILTGLTVVVFLGCGDDVTTTPPGGAVTATGGVGAGFGSAASGGSTASSGGSVTGGATGSQQQQTGGVSTGGASQNTGGAGEPTCTNGIQTGDDCNPSADTEPCERSDRTCECSADSTWDCTPNATGGTSATGGRSNTGGVEATGGGEATGGVEATGGGGSVEIPSDCSDGERTLTGNGTGQHCGYTYEYWKDQGSGSLVLKPDGFSVDWSNINNLLGRKGIRPGSGDLNVTYEADYQPNGNSYLCIYGWTRNPLVEYYIVDSWGSWRPPGGQGHVGTVETDGGTYDLYRTQRVNQPSIDGTATFDQYWSVRTEKRESGTITVGNHFAAWESNGLNMGSMYEVSMCVEGYQSSGTADVRMVMN